MDINDSLVSGGIVAGDTTVIFAFAMAGGPIAPCALHSYVAESSFLACLITKTERLLKFITIEYIRQSEHILRVTYNAQYTET